MAANENMSPQPADNCSDCKEPTVYQQSGTGVFKMHQSNGEFLCPEPTTKES